MNRNNILQTFSSQKCEGFTKIVLRFAYSNLKCPFLPNLQQCFLLHLLLLWRCCSSLTGLLYTSSILRTLSEPCMNFWYKYYFSQTAFVSSFFLRFQTTSVRHVSQCGRIFNFFLPKCKVMKFNKRKCAHLSRQHMHSRPLTQSFPFRPQITTKTQDLTKTLKGLQRSASYQ